MLNFYLFIIIIKEKNMHFHCFIKTQLNLTENFIGVFLIGTYLLITTSINILLNQYLFYEMLNSYKSVSSEQS